jgi:hypothetical protein
MISLSCIFRSPQDDSLTASAAWTEPGLTARAGHSGLRLPTRPFKKPPVFSDAGLPVVVGCSSFDADLGLTLFALPVAFFATVLALSVVFLAAAFAPLGFLAAAVAFFAVAPGLAAGVLRAVVPPPDDVSVGLIAEIVWAALVSASAAAASALVAVFIVFMAVFIACADVVALVAASVILVAADDTLVAADDTRVAAAAGVTDFVADLADVDLRAVPPVVFLADVVFFVPLVLAVERRDERVIVFVGTDPSPRCRSASGGSIPQLAKIYTPIGCQTVFVSRKVVIR